MRLGANCVTWSLLPNFVFSGTIIRTGTESVFECDLVCTKIDERRQQSGEASFGAFTYHQVGSRAVVAAVRLAVNDMAMSKTILVTGASDGIGLATARALADRGHLVLLHGRNAEKIERVAEAMSLAGGRVEKYVADLSRQKDVESLADAVCARHSSLDVLINNAGVFKTGGPTVTPDGRDIRFVVNTVSPYLLTKRLLPIMEGVQDARVVNVSSIAAAPVDLDALSGKVRIQDDYQAYAQSKLAMNMWTYHMATQEQKGVVLVAVNPGSLLATKMVKEGFGINGNDVGIGADILVRAALSDEFAPHAQRSGRFFDNDAGCFARGHPHNDDSARCAAVMREIESQLAL
ncbi:Retinol dehydrogenase 13 [Porphyridium purpureum]|uniref:Retinol dehydrogenase 13 n=1 Tax=Porphyridium purpureum TaxID=35688 RepID=A0A5J4YKA9_PORPP|nr:Retinol dehydrogenase 13 [Porphyridium purpureum]|eukprot:POR7784..scf289_17